ncbi:DUF6049 family protein [Candidatus Protofrankia californiensis]|uniref:DUF6049 family protein n=1 Tax=Candidatus Protofrankia californiensis TaxID=1839754 RepID=UPI0024B5FF42|nr:DUF6049 family protein [Candidatus Protofrankia californiensis]
MTDSHVYPAVRCTVTVAAIVLSVTIMMLGATAVHARADPPSTGFTHISTGSPPGPSGLPGSASAASPQPPLQPTRAVRSTTAVATGATRPVRVALDEFAAVAGPQLPLNVTGHLELTGADQISDLEIRIELARVVSSRKDLANLRDNPAAAAALSYSTAVASQPVASRLVPGALPVTFTAGAKLTGLGLPAALRVYPLRFTASGMLNGQRKVVGTTYSFLVWAPVAVTGPMPISVVLPVAEVPRLRADGRLTNDDLTDLVAPGGRLDRLLSSVAPVGSRPVPPVALAVDPVLVQTLQIIAGGPYEVATPSGPSPRRPDRDAAAFLAKLKAFADAGGTVFALPYGDVDMVALTRAQEFHSILVALLTGRTVVANAIGRSPDTTIAYPGDGLVDAPTLDVLRRMGITTVIADSNLLPPKDPEKTYTPSTATEIPTSGGVARVLAADPQLADLATGPTSDADAPTQAESFQDLLAEIAMIAAERPGLVRPQTLALPRYWDPPAGWAETVLEGLSTPFSRLAALTSTPPVGGTSTGAVPAAGERGPLTYPDWARAAELPVSRMIATEDLRNQVHALKSVLCPPDSGASGARNCADAGIDAMEYTLTSSESIAWRASAAGTDGADELSTGVAGVVQALREGIRVVASRSVSLTSKHGTVPVTLENNTAVIINVVLSLSSTDRARLRSETKVKLTVPPLQKVQVEIEVDAEGAGTFPVDVAILTPAGKPLSTAPPVRILVKSTVFGVIAVAITGGALAVLAFAVVIRLLRRLRTLRDRTPAGASPRTGPLPLRTEPSPANPARPAHPDDPPASAVADGPGTHERRGMPGTPSSGGRRTGVPPGDGLERLLRASHASGNTGNKGTRP